MGEIDRDLLENIAETGGALWATLLQQEYRLHEGRWWLFTKGEAARPLTAVEILEAHRDGRLPIKVLLVLSSTYQVSDWVMRRFGIEPRRWRYLNTANVVRGVDRPTVLIYEWYSSWLPEFEGVLKEKKAIVVNLSEEDALDYRSEVNTPK